MASVTIVSGCPGSGKSTLSTRLAHRREFGVRIETDRFYHFLAHRLDPTTPESNLQNTAVVKAFIKSARSFFEDGYDVFVDGVIGPWWFETIRHELPTFDCVYLHADLETVMQRTRERARTTQASAHPEMVRTMHRQFDALRDIASRTIHTTNKSPDAILDEFIARQAQGEFS